MLTYTINIIISIAFTFSVKSLLRLLDSEEGDIQLFRNVGNESKPTNISGNINLNVSSPNTVLNLRVIVLAVTVIRRKTRQYEDDIRTANSVSIVLR